MRAVLIAIAIASPAIAAADDTLETELRALALPSPTERGFHASAFAQLVGGTSGAPEGSVAAGGELLVHRPWCDYLRAGGQVRLAYSDAAHPSAEQLASVCIPVTTFELGHHLEWDVRPSLLAPLVLRGGENRRETISFHWTPLKGKLGHVLASIEAGEAKKQGIALDHPMDPDDPSLPQGDLVIFDVRLEWMILWARGQPLAMRQTPEATPVEYVKRHLAAWGEPRDFVVDIFTGGGAFVDDGAAIHMWLLRIQNLALGPIYATGGIGIASGGVGKFVGMSREVDVTTPRAELALETGGSAIHGHVRATNDVELNPDGYVAREARLAAGLGGVLAGTRVLAEAAVARAIVQAPASPHIRGVTGGGSLAVAHRLVRHLDATVRVEAARSFYATAGALDFVPRWGATAFAALQATTGR